MGSRLTAGKWTTIRTLPAAALLAIVAAVIMLPEERMGWLSSLAAALLVLAGTAVTVFRNRRPA